MGPRWTSPSDATPRRSGERGAAMIGLLATLIVIGILAAVILSNQSTPSINTGQVLGGVTTTTAPATIASGANEAAITACEADFQAVWTALSSYRAMNGVVPPSGTAWATSAARGGPFLQLWPGQAQHFTLVWNGSTILVVPAHGAPSRGTFGTAKPATGCFNA